MKIALFVSVIDQIGGAEIGTRRLAEQLARWGHQITLFGTQPLSQFRAHPQILGYTKDVKVIRLPAWQRSRRSFRVMLTAQALWAFPLLLRGTQIVHLRGLTPETIRLAHIARRLGMKTLCVPMASGAFGDAAVFPPDQPHDSTAFDWLSALSEPLREEMIAWGFPAERTGVIPNGVDTELFQPPQHPYPDAHVIFVGQFRPEKRVDLLLRAWQTVQRSCPQAHLTLVGGGRDLPEYRQLAAQLEITPQFVPDTADVLAHLQASSLFVLPGISEGMSNALLEAMAVGLACIVSDRPANRAVIAPQIDGLCYSADDPDALAAQLRRLIDDSDLRKRLGTTARQTVLSRFELASVAEQYLALYARLLEMGESA